MTRLAAGVRAAGIERFTATVVDGDGRPRRFRKKVTDEMEERGDGDTVEVFGRGRDSGS